jgi:hypothetical protein
MTHEHSNLALTQEAVSAAVPDREYLIWRDRRFTYRQLTERSRGPRFRRLMNNQNLTTCTCRSLGAPAK